jgi:hypothetical protein
VFLRITVVICNLAGWGSVEEVVVVVVVMVIEWCLWIAAGR